MKKQISKESNKDLLTYTTSSGKISRKVNSMSVGEWKQVSGCASEDQKGKRPTYHSGMSDQPHEPH